jgi:hypothetical protein
MYQNQRRAQLRVSGDAVIRDVTTETCDLRVSILHVGTSPLCVSRVVVIQCHVHIAQDNKNILLDVSSTFG